MNVLADSSNEGLGNNLNDLVKYHHSIQEKIADHMLDLTRTLKEQVTIAGQVVKRDTEVRLLFLMLNM